jgi:hypothetical protein
MLQPDNAEALVLAAAALAEAGEPEPALAHLRRAALLRPDQAAIHANLGKLLAACGRFQEAEASFATAVRLAPSHLPVALNRAYGLLKAGDPRGWQAAEARHRQPGRTRLPEASRLRPGMEVANRTVLLWHEEGFGDTLMMLRYARELAGRGARVVVWVPAPLLRLAALADGVAAAIVDGPGTFDLHCPMLSLPALLGAGSEVPYLHAATVDPVVAALPGLRCGLCWAGGARPWDPAAVTIDRQRSLALGRLAPLALPGVSLVSLQAGERADDAAPPGMALHRPLVPGGDFAATASVVAALDVVVSVDTAVAHLAAGLGRPVLLLDRWDGCWRWGHGRDSTPWYPGMRLLRQARAGAWDGPVERAAAMLKELAGA